MIVVVSRIRVSCGTPHALMVLDKALRRLPAGAHAAARPILVGERDSLGEVAP